MAGPTANPVILRWLQVEGGGASWIKDDATPPGSAASAGSSRPSARWPTSAGFLAVKWQWVTLGIAAYFAPRVLWDGHQIRLLRAEDHNEGYTS